MFESERIYRFKGGEEFIFNDKNFFLSKFNFYFFFIALCIYFTPPFMSESTLLLDDDFHYYSYNQTVFEQGDENVKSIKKMTSFVVGDKVFTGEYKQSFSEHWVNRDKLIVNSNRTISFENGISINNRFKICPDNTEKKDSVVNCLSVYEQGISK